MTTTPINKRIGLFFKKSLSTLLGIKLSILALVVFLLFGYPEIFTDLPNFRPRNYGVGVLSIYGLVTLAICYFGNWSKRRGVSMWFQTNLLVLYSLIFYLRLNSPTFSIAGIEINSRLSFIPLLVLIFLVNRNLFNQLKNQTYLLVSQVFLVSLSTFSLLSLLSTTFTDATNFRYQILFEFFDLSPIVWIVVSSLIISLISTLNLKVNKYSEVILFTLIQTSLYTPIFYILNTLSLTYWYMTLLFLIFWDFVYHPLNAIIHGESVTNFYSKLGISLLYHIGLFALVVFAFNNPIF